MAGTLTASAAAPASRLPRLGFAARRRLFLVMIGLPALLYMVLVALWPLGQGLHYSFTDYTLTRPGPINWVGLENYRDMFADPSVRRAILNTFVFTAAAVGSQLVGSGSRCCSGATAGSTGSASPSCSSRSRSRRWPSG
jgi:multiple sugar transport system permease protein